MVMELWGEFRICGENKCGNSVLLAFRRLCVYCDSCSLLFLCRQRIFRIFYNLSSRVYNRLEKTIPGFSTVMEKVQADYTARVERRKRRREAEKKAEQEQLYGRVNP